MAALTSDAAGRAQCTALDFFLQLSAKFDVVVDERFVNPLTRSDGHKIHCVIRVQLRT
jgi:hypothetical protein